jgi:hypothetical protein
MPIFQLIKNQAITKFDNLSSIWWNSYFEALVKASRLQQQNEKVGGPQDLDTLFSIIKSDFQNFEVLELEEKKFNEGQFHNGLAW